MKVLDDNRIAIQDHNREGNPRAMDLVRRPDGRVVIEMKGKGRWDIDYSDAKCQMDEGIEHFNKTPM